MLNLNLQKNQLRKQKNSQTMFDYFCFFILITTCGFSSKMIVGFLLKVLSAIEPLFFNVVFDSFLVSKRTIFFRCAIIIKILAITQKITRPMSTFPLILSIKEIGMLDGTAVSDATETYLKIKNTIIKMLIAIKKCKGA